MEVEATSDFPSSFPLFLSENCSIDIKVEYPWKLLCCKSCCIFGHTSSRCSATIKQVWVPKSNGSLSNPIPPSDTVADSVVTHINVDLSAKSVDLPSTNLVPNSPTAMVNVELNDGCLGNPHVSTMDCATKVVSNFNHFEALESLDWCIDEGNVRSPTCFIGCSSDTNSTPENFFKNRALKVDEVERKEISNKKKKQNNKRAFS